MPGMDLTDDWQEAKAGLSMTDGESYVVEFHGPPDTTIYALDVEGSTKPTSTQNALRHFNRDRNPRATDALEFQARSGWTWWLKAEGSSRIVSAKV